MDLDGTKLWLATERSGIASVAYPYGKLSDSPWASPSDMDEDEGVFSIVRARAESSGPFTVVEIARELHLDLARVEIAVARLETLGVLLRGNFRKEYANTSGHEYCDRRILSRIHATTVGLLRKEIEPVPVSVFLQF